ncbi:hypothetical protein MSAN_01719400 [Mycena sanguinolenta]|uniref:DUF6534 domain-containing protein n=1 Tax=Mycena sanguinolenta TaxID=230812 RepID=A0A8H7CT11_9AGAR|nr:hypothetical protein MSAN_01719400 [Mycena sanguinolenta]
MVSSSLAFANNVGAYQIGVLVSYVLLGVTTTQTYVYFRRFPDDSRSLKALVAVVWVCELTHALCVGNALYAYTISSYRHPAMLNNSPWTLHVAFIIVSFIVACVQGFFGVKIYGFSGKLYIPVLIWVLACLRLVASASIFLLPLNPLNPENMGSNLNIASSWELFCTAAWITSVINDVLITITLVLLLRRQRAGLPRRTTALVDKIIIWSIETGMMTSALGIVELLCFLVLSYQSWTWIAISTVEARIFANSFLASLNGRTTLRALSDAPLSFVIPTMETFSSVQIMSARQNISDSVSHSGQTTKEGV